MLKKKRVDKYVRFPTLPFAMTPEASSPQSRQNDRIQEGRKLADIEERLRERYLDLRTQRFPGQPRQLSSNFDKHWTKMAEIVYDLQADPVEWIDSHCNKPGVLPYPINMLSDEAIDRFKKVMDNVSASPSDLVHTHRFYIESLLTRTNASELEIFMNTSIDLRAWYRVIFAPEVIADPLVKKFGEVAEKQIKSDKKLQQYLEQNYGDRIERIIPKVVSAEFSGPHNPVPPPSEAALRYTSW